MLADQLEKFLASFRTQLWEIHLVHNMGLRQYIQLNFHMRVLSAK